MGKIPNELRKIIARNIKECRLKKFPGRGGAKQCAGEFGVSPQQWSPWESGGRTPDELRLSQIAEFFGVTVEWMRSAHYAPPDAADMPLSTTKETPPPLLNPAPPGSPASFFWLAHRFVNSLETNGLRLDKQSLEHLARCVKSL